MRRGKELVYMLKHSACVREIVFEHADACMLQPYALGA